VIDDQSARQLAQVVVRGLARGQSVEIDGLGIFHPDPACGCRFEARTLAQVFVAYAKEDRPAAQRLYGELSAAGFSPWMDVAHLLPGQNWPRAIESAIETSDFFIACFSENAVGKRGGFQAEIRYALDCARRVPLDEIYLIPVRLDDCRVPCRIHNELQYVDLFPDWTRGVRRLIGMLQREAQRR
jgi:hypothetical protein